MPIPTRSCSLRQPGFARRELQAVEDTDGRNTNKVGLSASPTRIIADIVPEKATRFSTLSFDIGHRAVGPTSDQKLPNHPKPASTDESRYDLHAAAKKPEITNGGSLVELDVMPYSRLPSPTKMTTSSAETEPVPYQKHPSSVPRSIAGNALPQKSQIGRSSSLRQPSSRSALSQTGNSRGHGKGPSIPHSSGQTSSFQTVTETTRADTRSSTRDITLIGPKLSTRDIAKGYSGTAYHQRKVSATHHGRQTSPEPSRSAHSNADVPKARPQFSTYQQHFTPKKAPKAPAPRVLGSESEGDVSSNASIETLRLQDELLQLSLLYTSACVTRQAWGQSAKRKLRRRFDQVTRQSEEQAFAHQMQQAQHNLEVLQQWISKGTCSPTEKVQALSQCIRDVTNMTRSDGKVARLVEEFQQWLSLVTDITVSETKQMMISINPLGLQWKSEARAALRVMEQYREQLKRLGTIDVTAAIGKTLDHHAIIVAQTITELNLMLEIESMAIAYTRQYTTRAITETLVLAESDLLPAETPRKGIWNTT